MPEKYTVTEVREWKPDAHGNNVFYVDTDEVQDAYYATKGSGPVVGQTYEWELSHSDKGPRFKNPQKEGYENKGSSGGGKKSGGGGYRKSPEDDRKITRLAAHKVAVEVVNPIEDWDKFTNLCDMLCEDAFAFGGAGQPEAAAAPQVSLDELKKQFQAGLTNVGAALTDGVAAIGATYGREKLEVGDDVPKLIALAKELAEADVPF